MTRSDHQHLKEQLGVQRLDGELTLRAGLGVFAAIDVAGGAKKPGAEPWPGRINEDRCVGQVQAGRGCDHAGQVGPGFGSGSVDRPEQDGLHDNPQDGSDTWGTQAHAAAIPRST